MQGHLLLGRLEFWPKRLSGFGDVTLKGPHRELKLAPETALVLYSTKFAKELLQEGSEPS